LALALGAGARAADEPFSRALRPDDFSAAGLNKLSPEELARLDALVRDFKSGALTSAASAELAAKLAAAQREAAAAAQARADAEARATKAEAQARAATEARSAATASAAEKKPETSLLARAKVLLTPGTQIEYTTVESRIVGE